MKEVADSSVEMWEIPVTLGFSTSDLERSRPVKPARLANQAKEAYFVLSVRASLIKLHVGKKNTRADVLPSRTSRTYSLRPVDRRIMAAILQPPAYDADPAKLPTYDEAIKSVLVR